MKRKDNPVPAKKVAVAKKRTRKAPSSKSKVQKPPPGKGSVMFPTICGFRALLDRTLLCVSKDDSRPVLMFAELLVEEKGISIATSDGFTLLVQKVDAVEVDASLQGSRVLIPPSFMKEARRVLPSRPSAAGEITLEWDPETVTLRLPMFDVTYKTERCDLNFPKYRQLIPKVFGKNAQRSYYAVNPEYMVRLGKIFKDASKVRCYPPATPSNPAAYVGNLEEGQDTNLTFVVMPMFVQW